MIVHIFTIKICGMVNETIISTYEIVNLRTILIFVGKNYFSETKGGGYLKCLRSFRGGGRPNVYVRLQGGEGGQKCPEFCLRGLYTVPCCSGSMFNAYVSIFFDNFRENF